LNNTLNGKGKKKYTVLHIRNKKREKRGDEHPPIPLNRKRKTLGGPCPYIPPTERGEKKKGGKKGVASLTVLEKKKKKGDQALQLKGKICHLFKRVLFLFVAQKGKVWKNQVQPIRKPREKGILWEKKKKARCGSTCRNDGERKKGKKILHRLV